MGSLLVQWMLGGFWVGRSFPAPRSLQLVVEKRGCRSLTGGNLEGEVGSLGPRGPQLTGQRLWG